MIASEHSLEEELYAQIRFVCRRRGDRVYRDRPAQQCRGWLLSNGRDWLSLVSLLLGSPLYLPAPSRLPARPLLVPLISRLYRQPATLCLPQSVSLSIGELETVHDMAAETTIGGLWR